MSVFRAVFIGVLIVITLASCTQQTNLQNGETVVHTNRWGEANRHIRVYGTGRDPQTNEEKLLWKTYTWVGTTYVCTALCLGSEAPLRDVTWPTPRYTDPYKRRERTDFGASGLSIPLTPTVTPEVTIPSAYTLPTE